MMTSGARGIPGYLPSWTATCGTNPSLNSILDELDAWGTVIEGEITDLNTKVANFRVVNVLDFANGITIDDGSNGAAFAFIDAIATMSDGDVLYVPTGTYFINSQIILDGKAIIIELNGSTLTTKTQTGNIFTKTDHDKAPTIRNGIFRGSGTAIRINNSNYNVGEVFDMYVLNCKFRMAGKYSADKTGTVTNSIYSSTLTGTGTLFTSQFSVGDYIHIGNQIVKIADIASDTSLTIDGYFTQANTNITYRAVTPAYGMRLYGAKAIKIVLCNFDDVDNAANSATITSYGQIGVFLELCVEPHIEMCTFIHNLEAVFFSGYGLFDGTINSLAYDAGLRIHNSFIQGNVYGVRVWYIDYFEFSASLIDLNIQRNIVIWGTDQGHVSGCYLGHTRGPAIIIDSGYKAPSQISENITFVNNSINSHDETGTWGTYGLIQLNNFKCIQFVGGNKIHFFRDYGIYYTNGTKLLVSDNDFAPRSGLGTWSVYCPSGGGDANSNFITSNTMAKRCSTDGAILRNNSYNDGPTPYIERIGLQNFAGIVEVQGFESRSNYLADRGVKVGYYVPTGTKSSRLGGEYGVANASSTSTYSFISLEKSGSVSEKFRFTSDGYFGAGTASPATSLHGTITGNAGIAEVARLESVSNYAANRGVKQTYYVPNATSSSRLGAEMVVANSSTTATYAYFNIETGSAMLEAYRVTATGFDLKPISITTPVDAATQISSRQLLFTSWNWNGSAAINRQFGLYSKASTTTNDSNTLAFTYEGADILLMASNGRLTMQDLSFVLASSSNTTSPGGSASFLVRNTNTTTNNYSALSLQSAAGVATAVVAARHTNHTSSYASQLTFWTSTGGVLAERMTILEAGNVGINNTNPDEKLTVGGSISISTLGNGLKIKEGTNATMGLATLVAGSVTVATTKVTANSRIFISNQASAGTPGFTYISARVAGTSFTITSSNALDTSSVAWIIVEPAI